MDVQNAGKGSSKNKRGGGIGDLIHTGTNTLTKVITATTGAATNAISTLSSKMTGIPPVMKGGRRRSIRRGPMQTHKRRSRTRRSRSRRSRTRRSRSRRQ